ARRAGENTPSSQTILRPASPIVRRSAGYQSLPTAQFAAYLAGGPVPERAVLITFDDGYLNNWVHAHPVLARHGMRAVLFTITGWI
ncbi:polysaccharide deacetylase family protein, partial [Paenibacillus polymyxa]|nr:polysaccharide deacetylase family protein [Paenibacillus polymyxa]